MELPGHRPRDVGGAVRPVRMEPGFPTGMQTRLERLGHRLKPAYKFEWFGSQVIKADEEHSAYHGGSDPRVDGCIIGSRSLIERPFNLSGGIGEKRPLRMTPTRACR